jgi:hypothetical protein
MSRRLVVFGATGISAPRYLLPGLATLHAADTVSTAASPASAIATKKTPGPSLH